MAFVKDTRGAEVVEFALVLPILMFVLAAILDMGFLFNSYEVVTNAAREGARLAAIPGHTDTQIETRVANYVAAAGLKTGNVTTTITRPAVLAVGAGTINGVKVVVAYRHDYLVLGPIADLIQAGGSFNSATLTAVSTMRTEVAAGL